MAQKCAICGADINLVQQQKLADGQFICRKNCRKKGMTNFFDYIHGSLPDVIAHNEQVEKGTKLFEHYFVPRIKKKVKGVKIKQFGSKLFVAEDIGLMALAEPKYKFFIFGKYYPQACVYRIADLYSYKPEKVLATPDGKALNKTLVHFIFNNVEGLRDFCYDYSAKDVAKYFDGLFGIEKTLRNMGNTWKNQINAAKAMAGGISAAVGGAEDAEGKAAEAIDALNTAQFGDRTELIRKADEALAAFPG